MPSSPFAMSASPPTSNASTSPPTSIASTTSSDDDDPLVHEFARQNRRLSGRLGDDGAFTAPIRLVAQHKQQHYVTLPLAPSASLLDVEWPTVPGFEDDSGGSVVCGGGWRKGTNDDDDDDDAPGSRRCPSRWARSTAAR